MIPFSSFKAPWTMCAYRWTQLYIQLTMHWEQCPSALWRREKLSLTKWTRTCLIPQNSNFILHSSTQKHCSPTRCNQFFTNWNPTNKPTNLLMSTSVCKNTSNLIEDQATNPELQSAKKKKKKQEQRLFCKPWDKNRDQNRDQQSQKSSYKGKGRDRKIQRDSDTKPYRRDQR